MRDPFIQDLADELGLDLDAPPTLFEDVLEQVMTDGLAMVILPDGTMLEIDYRGSN
jgi:hypothetical protein